MHRSTNTQGNNVYINTIRTQAVSCIGSLNGNLMGDELQYVILVRRVVIRGHPGCIPGYHITNISLVIRWEMN